MTYEGEVNDDGAPHGQGIKTYGNGDRYEGEWKDGKRNGRGTYLSGGMRLIGQFDQSNFVKGEWWSNEAAGPVGSDIPITIEPTAGNYEISYHDGIMRLIDKEGNISWKLN